MYLQRKNEEIEYPEDATGIYSEKKGYFPLFKLPNSKTFNKKVQKVQTQVDFYRALTST